jgi:putative ABC transport system ATP-binding protein
MKSNLIIEMKNVRKTYRLGETTIEALRGINIEVVKGDFATLVGPSGSGKSTLLNMIGTLDTPDSGEIFLEQENVTKLPETKLCQIRNHKIGFVFQSFNLVPVLSVVENVELPLLLRNDLNAKQRREIAMQTLKDVGLETFPAHLPDKLSGGQRQRVALARALAPSPSIVLADEPTANLDSKTAHQMIDLLIDLNQRRGVTFLFCSHDEKLVGRVQKVFRIQDGVLLT